MGMCFAQPVKKQWRGQKIFFLAERGEDDLKDYDINRQTVFSALLCGQGVTSFNNFCEMVDLQGMHHKTFHTKANKLYNKLDDFERQLFTRTAEHVRQIHALKLALFLAVMMCLTSASALKAPS